MYKYNFYLLILCTLFFSCKKQEISRKPIAKSKSTETELSIKRNTEMIVDEELFFQEYIEKDKKNDYIQSNKGFWYTYLNRQIKDSVYPEKGNIVSYSYEVYDTSDSLLYAKSDFGTLNYKVDEEDILPVLRNSLKILKPKETIKVLSPSLLAYGYMGDQNKITKNQPLIFVINLESINKSN